jgi:nucleotide-binding universal stress UspA family protein
MQQPQQKKNNPNVMKKILCPTDFSETAQTAIAYAAKLAKATGCSLTLLHVKSVFDFSFAEITDAKHISTTRVAEELEVQSKKISKTFKISCYAEVVSRINKLSSLITDEAEGYDLIVMGSNGADDLYQFFSGSNTYNTIVQSNIPVLLVPLGYTYCEIQTMVYAYDYLRERKLPLADLATFVKSVNCRLTVLQVMEEAVSKDAEDELKELQFIFKTYASEGINYEYDTIRSTEVAPSINSYILRNQPDVLALCSVHRTLLQEIFHKSIIKNISAASNYPIYVFHD